MNKTKCNNTSTFIPLPRITRDIIGWVIILPDKKIIGYFKTQARALKFDKEKYLKEYGTKVVI